MSKSQKSWDKSYEEKERIWGDTPSELARITVDRLRQRDPDRLDILEIGCGYGRDAAYISDQLDARMLSTDPSQVAIGMAQATCNAANVSFRCCNFAETSGTYDVVMASNVYHVLQSEERRRFSQVVAERLRPGGLLFLNTLSTRDPQHYGKGNPVTGEPNSFVNKRYLHFCTRDELRNVFGHLTIEELYEHAYHEPLAEGGFHDHVSWVLIARANHRTQESELYAQPE
jgi:cyclopropane fatty-acyl-phospholipid synthase-like methyltransferase